MIEVMDAVRAVTGMEFTHDLVDRRAGDPARLVASADKIRTELGWTASLRPGRDGDQRLGGLAGQPARLSVGRRGHPSSGS